MNVLVTGGTGLTGVSMLRKLVTSGETVHALFRDRKRDIPGVNWIHGDLKDPQLDIRKLLDAADVVIHNAASLKAGATPAEKEEIQLVNIRFVERLSEAIKNSSVKKLIFTSSLSFLKKPLPDPVTEESDVQPLSPYANSKLEGEKMVTEVKQELPIDVIILRLSSPVSEQLQNMPQTVLRAWIEKSIRKETITVFGDGSRTQDFVSVEDISQAFLNATRIKNVSGIFNIASGNAISMLDVAKIITGKFGNGYELAGEDANNSDRWNVSIEKAKHFLHYAPELTSRQAVMNLVNAAAR